MADTVRKGALRDDVLAARKQLSPAQWALDDERRLEHVLEVVSRLEPGTVAVYVSRPGEPDTHPLIDALLARGCRVLIPKLRRHPDWGWFPGWDAVVPGWGEIPHPPGPGLGAESLAEADLVLLPCLAIGRDGTRLGTGGGWYDRALAHRRPDAVLVALAREAEVLDTVPTLPHDVAVHGHVTERGWALR